jgi:hypothetical protein
MHGGRHWTLQELVEWKYVNINIRYDGLSIFGYRRPKAGSLLSQTVILSCQSHILCYSLKMCLCIQIQGTNVSVVGVKLHLMLNETLDGSEQQASRFGRCIQVSTV